MTTSDEIRLVLKAKAAARVARKADDLNSLIHNDFIYVNAAGQTFDKDRYVETYCTSGIVVFTQQRFVELTVKTIDDFAVAVLLINDEFVIKDRVASRNYLALCVFGRSSERWLWAAGQTMDAGSA